MRKKGLVVVWETKASVYQLAGGGQAAQMRSFSGYVLRRCTHEATMGAEASHARLAQR